MEFSLPPRRFRCQFRIGRGRLLTSSARGWHGPSAKAEEGENGQNNDHETDNINDVVHGKAPFCLAPSEHVGTEMVHSGMFMPLAAHAVGVRPVSGCAGNVPGAAVVASGGRMAQGGMPGDETMIQLIQILIPLRGNDEDRGDALASVRAELVERFGGATAFSRAPAEGFWETDGQTVRDDIIVVEVMTESIDGDWWAGYREQLERRFSQDVVVIRHHAIELL
jgi:hypothetical protein